MELSMQVCTIEQSKILNETGIVQGFTQYYHDSQTGVINENEQFVAFYKAHYCFSAFSVKELNFMLGHAQHNDISFLMPGTTDLPEAHAKAEFLIHLLKTNQIKAEDVNGRLFEENGKCELCVNHFHP